MSRRIEVFLNRHAGGSPGQSERDTVEQWFKQRGVTATITTLLQGSSIDQVKARLGPSSTLVVAGGGDGTISAVAAAIVGTDHVLGVLPMGTLNHFSKDLGIPQEPDAAVDVVVNGAVTTVDVGEVNGRIFLNNSSLGVYPIVVLNRDVRRGRLGHGKIRAFAAAMLHLFRRYPRLQLRMIIDGKNIFRRSPFLFVGNNPYELAAFDVGARSRLDGAELGIYLTPRTNRFDLLFLLGRGLFGRLARDRDFESYRTDSAQVEISHRDILVALDGEVVRMTGPLHYRTRPGSLRVMIPRPQSDT